MQSGVKKAVVIYVGTCDCQVQSGVKKAVVIYVGTYLGANCSTLEWIPSFYLMKRRATTTPLRCTLKSLMLNEQAGNAKEIGCIGS